MGPGSEQEAGRIRSIIYVVKMLFPFLPANPTRGSPMLKELWDSEDARLKKLRERL